MLVLSCINCCFNGLQYDTIGMSVGYCTEHKRVLNTPSTLTCGRLLRKDLLVLSARREREQHANRYSSAAVCFLETAGPANGGTNGASAAELAHLEKDQVGSVVLDYGRLPTKIVSLAQLNAIGGARAELALLSLARSYVDRCSQRGGAWTSGLHVLWWTRKRLGVEPLLEIGDIRTETPLPIHRQLDLAKWALVVLRVSFVADVAWFAQGTGHRVAGLSSLAEEAVEHAGLNWRKLLQWLRNEAVARFDRALSEKTYRRLSEELHKDPFDGEPG